MAQLQQTAQARELQLLELLDAVERQRQDYENILTDPGTLSNYYLWLEHHLGEMLLNPSFYEDNNIQPNPSAIARYQQQQQQQQQQPYPQMVGQAGYYSNLQAGTDAQQAAAYAQGLQRYAPTPQSGMPTATVDPGMGYAGGAPSYQSAPLPVMGGQGNSSLRDRLQGVPPGEWYKVIDAASQQNGFRGSRLVLS